MGKATIIGDGDRNLQRGQYRIRIEKSDDRAEAELRRIDTEVRAIDSNLSTLQSEYSEAEKAYSNAASDLSAVIQQSRETPDEDYSDKLSAASLAERAAATTYAAAKSRYQSARLKRRSLQGKNTYLNDRITSDVRTVWCADCQRGLSGTVATIEIPNTDDTIMIRPGGADGSGSTYLAARDGQLRSVAAMSPAEAAWNYTMFPAWQKWKPLYRLGKILERAPNNSKCTVLLDAYSTAQGLATDVERRLTNVPMVYKNRDDGGPYQIGDRVVVEFYNQNWEAPRVVGFEQDPCTTSSITTTTVATTTTIPYEYILLRADGVLEQRSIEDGTIIESYDTNIYTSPLPCPYPDGPATKYHAIAKIPDGYIMQNTESQTLLVYDDLARTTLLDSFSINYPDIYGYLPSCGDYPEYVVGYIRDLAYDSVTGNLVATIGNTEYLTSNSLVVIYDGISNTVLNTFSIPEPSSLPGYGPGIYGITVHNGNLIVSGQYTDKDTLTDVGKIWILDGLTSTITDSIIYPTGGLPPFRGIVSHRLLDMVGSDLMGYYYQDDTGSPPSYISTNFVLHDGITSDELYNYELPTVINIEGRQPLYVQGICLP